MRIIADHMTDKEKLRGKKREGEEIPAKYDNIKVFYYFKERIRFLYRQNLQESRKDTLHIIEEVRSYKR